MSGALVSTYSHFHSHGAFLFPGMRGLLARTVGFPHIVHYEEQPRVTTLAGFPLGAVQTLLESYGYTCARLDRSDISCKKPRVQGRWTSLESP